MQAKPSKPYTTYEKGRGQTLAEFAISLPLLLILVFGVIEFGRLFQSWVTLQNSARTAARYAVTGAYDESKYNMDVLIPCTTDAANLQIATRDVPIYDPSGGDSYNQVQIFQVPPGGDTENSEHLFATWYGVPDCYPDDDTLQMRRNMLRLASIYDEARRGASGLLLDRSLTGTGSKADFQNFLYSTWNNPSRQLASRDWFNVVVCSGTNRIFGIDTTEVVGNPDDIRSLNPATQAQATLRFHTDVDGSGWSPMSDGASSQVPACLLKERPLEDTGLPDNYNVPWQDPGGAGERITIMVTYNHPLITPLGIADFIQIRAIRAAVNESFRVTNAERVLGPPPGGRPSFESPTPEPDTPTPTYTFTPPPTATPTATTTATATFTPAPFQCDNLDVRTVTYNGPRFFIEFSNANDQPTTLKRSVVHWPDEKLKQEFPNIYLAFQALSSEVHWQGQPGVTVNSPIDTASDGTFFAASDRTVPPGGFKVYWEGVFVNGPGLLAQYTTVWDFGGSTFYFDDPGSDVDCEIELTLPPPPPPPTQPPPGFEPSATFTPDCASTLMRVQFVEFAQLGVVHLRVVNNRYAVGPFTAMHVVWPQRPGLRLVSVIAGGANAFDTVDNGGTGVVVWTGAGSGDAQPPSSSSNPADGTWLTDYTFSPNSITNLWLRFSGTGVSSLAALGVHPSDFNGTWFEIGCGSTGGGGGGGGGGGASGTIFLDEAPPPPATLVPPPTPTPGPTLTPSNTPTPAPPTNTWTPAPPTNTFTPSPTAQATHTPTLEPDEDEEDRYCASGC